jgi:hypothetical protein
MESSKASPYDRKPQNHRQFHWKGTNCAGLARDRAFSSGCLSMGTGQNKGVCEIGMEINTGIVIVGNVGPENRAGYTAIGDSVNVAA